MPDTESLITTIEEFRNLINTSHSQGHLDRLTRNNANAGIDTISQALRKHLRNQRRLISDPENIKATPHPRPLCISHGLPIITGMGQCQSCIDGKAPGGSDENYRVK